MPAEIAAAGRVSAAPAIGAYRLEAQYGGTFGGRLIRDKTFFFGSYQRWTDRRIGAGTTLNGTPTAAGRTVLRAVAGDLPQVEALLKRLPVADAPIGRSVTFVRNGQAHVVEQGSLTGSADVLLNNHQPRHASIIRSGASHTLTGRYLYNKRFTSGVDAQVTPPGLLHMFNATNTRNFGIPEGRVNNPGFLNQWGTDGGNRRIWGALRFVF